jgi:hypothetical protein
MTPRGMDTSCENKKKPPGFNDTVSSNHNTDVKSKMIPITKYHFVLIKGKHYYTYPPVDFLSSSAIHQNLAKVDAE